MLEKLNQPLLRWDDFSWIRDNWKGPVFIKGILDPEDAEIALDRGADGIVVSNHGGRQLDHAQASLDALPAVVERVAGRVPVLLDGGIRRGTDVIKALCLGARAVLVGRAYVYGLTSNGSSGAQHVIEILREEIERAMTLMGVANISELNSDWLIPSQIGRGRLDLIMNYANKVNCENWLAL